jgi:hypothetical protein
MSDDFSRLTKRIQQLETRVSYMASLINRITRMFFRRRPNAYSQHLTPQESAEFRAEMAAHGVDDESRNEKFAKT